MTKTKLSPWKNNFEFVLSLKPEINFSNDNNPTKPNYLNFLNWDSTNLNAFEDTDDDFFEWVMDYEVDSDWKKETV